MQKATEEFLAELQKDWGRLNVEVELVEEFDEPGDYGYDVMTNSSGDDVDGSHVAHYSFSCPTDDKLDELVSPLGLEVVFDVEGEAYVQYWYDASPIITGDIYTLGSDPQPGYYNPEDVLNYIPGNDENEDEDEDEE